MAANDEDDALARKRAALERDLFGAGRIDEPGQIDIFEYSKRLARKAKRKASRTTQVKRAQKSRS